MAGKSSKKPQPEQKPKAFDEFEDDGEVFEDDVPDLDLKEPASPVRSRDWRDVEKHRELLELRKLVGDDDFETLLNGDLAGDTSPAPRAGTGKKKKKRK